MHRHHQHYYRIRLNLFYVLLLSYFGFYGTPFNTNFTSHTAKIHSHQWENLISVRILLFKYTKNKLRCINALRFYNSVAFQKKHFKTGIQCMLFTASILQNKTRLFKKYLQNKFSFVMISLKCILTFRTSPKQQPPFH